METERESPFHTCIVIVGHCVGVFQQFVSALRFA